MSTEAEEIVRNESKSFSVEIRCIVFHDVEMAYRYATIFWKISGDLVFVVVFRVCFFPPFLLLKQFALHGCSTQQMVQTMELLTILYVVKRLCLSDYFTCCL